MKSVAFCTLGCKVNQYETDAMEELFQKNGYEIKDFHEEADVYVINTCTVTNMADRKSRQMLHRARKKIRMQSLSLQAVMHRPRLKRLRRIQQST